MSDQQLYWARGLPASGKTYWAKRFVAEKPDERVRVSLDDLRHMVGPYDNFTKDREKTVLRLQEKIVMDSLKQGKSVVVDATHLHSGTPAKLAPVLWEHGYGDLPWVIEDFTNVPPEVCVERDIERGPAGGMVGAEVMDRMKRTLGKHRGRGLWTVDQVKKPYPKIERYYPNEALPACYTFDIDGSLAHARSRGPYDFDKLKEDLLDVSLAETSQQLRERGYKVVICTGRKAEYKQTTEEWLQWYGVQYDDIYTRASRDERRDSIIKYEIFRDKIFPKYNVIAHFDDRDRVVQALRLTGLSVYQVDAGDF